MALGFDFYIVNVLKDRDNILPLSVRQRITGTNDIWIARMGALRWFSSPEYYRLKYNATHSIVLKGRPSFFRVDGS